MKKIPQDLIGIIQEGLKGSRLEKFNKSLDLLNASIESGGYVKGASRSIPTGFSGLGIDIERQHRNNFDSGLRNIESDLSRALRSGIRVRDIDACVKYYKTIGSPKKIELVEAYLEFLQLVHEATEELDLSRPLPVLTKIGLSPKVTATLKEMNLDLDLSTIKMAQIDFKWVPKLNINRNSPEYLKPMLNGEGKPMMIKEFFVAWTEGAVFKSSRFSRSGCHACGKRIPSNLYVPVEVMDLKSGKLQALWLGRDCASNIFGIKDAGILIGSSDE